MMRIEIAQAASFEEPGAPAAWAAPSPPITGSTPPAPFRQATIRADDLAGTKRTITTHLKLGRALIGHLPPTVHARHRPNHSPVSWPTPALWPLTPMNLIRARPLTGRSLPPLTGVTTSLITELHEHHAGVHQATKTPHAPSTTASVAENPR